MNCPNDNELMFIFIDSPKVFRCAYCGFECNEKGNLIERNNAFYGYTIPKEVSKSRSLFKIKEPELELESELELELE